MENNNGIIKGMLIALLVVYVISPLDLAPGVIDDLLVILLGAAQKALGMDYEKLQAAIARVFGRKGEQVVEANFKALAIGKEAQR